MARLWNLFHFSFILKALGLCLFVFSCVKSADGGFAPGETKVISTLMISPTVASLNVNTSFTFSASGGLVPYTFSIQSGGGNINSSSGSYTAPAAAGSAVVKVTDALGAIATTNITINALPLGAAPVISAVSNQTILEDNISGPIAFTITDVDSVLNCSTSMSATSSNGALLPVVNIVFGGVAPNCTVTMTPLLNANGLSNIVLSVSDGSSTAASSLSLMVTAVNDAPVVSAISNQTLKTDASVMINYTLTDVDNIMDCSTSVTVTSGTTSTIPNGDLVKGGVAPNCTLTVTPSLNIAGSSLITVVGSDGFLTSTQTFTITTVNVNSVSMGPNPFSLVNTGSTLQLIATATYSDASQANVTTNLNSTWSTNAASIATVNNAGSKGLVTAGSTSGNVNITATYKGVSGVSAGTIYLVTSLTVSQSVFTGGLGANFSVLAQAVLTPTGSSDVTAVATWSTSNAGVATVSGGVISFVGVGSAIITVSYAGFSQVINVTVQNKTLTSIAITPGSFSMAISATKNFTALATYSDASTQDVTASAIWTTSNAGIATISNAVPTVGRVTGIATGSATITATMNSIFGTAALTINAATLTSIAITPADSLITSGEKIQLTATGTFSDASTANITDQVAWSSSNTSAATISNAPGSIGLVTSLPIAGYLNTTITANLGTVTGTTPLGVNGATVSSILVTPSVSIPVGGTYNLKAWANLSDGGVIDVTDFAVWTSATTADVTVSNGTGSKGLITGVALGTSVISVIYGGQTGTRTVTVAGSQVITEVGTGLNGDYYIWSGAPPPASPFLVGNKKGSRIDAQVNFAWGSGAAPMGVSDLFSVRWTGFYVPINASTFLCLYSDDGIRMWLNGVQIINNWTDHSPTWNCSVAQVLTVGTKYSITIEFYENGGGAEAHLTQSPTSAAAAQTLTNAVPQSQLYPQ